LNQANRPLSRGWLQENSITETQLRGLELTDCPDQQSLQAENETLHYLLEKNYLLILPHPA